MISIIIPAFNEEKNIVRLLSSINTQTIKDREVIIIDDGSTDNTAQVARKFGTNVFIRSHEERSVQRNFGADKAKGEYLLFLDADMELEKGLLEDILVSIKNGDFAGVIIPELTVGESFTAKLRNFERQMYMGDYSIEVARFFKKDIFIEFGGYDPKLTGPEDYDLPYRISKKYRLTRSTKYIYHHEENLTLGKLLKKKFYYGRNGAYYAEKHPELVITQGTIFFRKAYLRNWRKFISRPLLGLSFIGVRMLETVWAVLGFISAVGIKGFIKTIINTIRSWKKT